jgi:hypothetical protein
LAYASVFSRQAGEAFAFILLLKTGFIFPNVQRQLMLDYWHTFATMGANFGNFDVTMQSDDLTEEQVRAMLMGGDVDAVSRPRRYFPRHTSVFGNTSLGFAARHVLLILHTRLCSIISCVTFNMLRSNPAVRADTVCGCVGVGRGVCPQTFFQGVRDLFESPFVFNFAHRHHMAGAHNLIQLNGTPSY